MDERYLGDLLGLRRERVQYVAETRSAIALSRWRDLEKESVGQSEAGARDIMSSIAAGFAIAGSSYALYDAAASSLCFRAAARCAWKAKLLIGAMFEVCAGKPTKSHKWTKMAREIDRPLRSDEFAALLLSSTYRSERGIDGGDETEVEVPSVLRGSRIGASGIPLEVFQAVHRDVLAKEPRATENAVDYILTIGHFAIERAMVRDRYHWKRLMSKLLPIAPEVLAPAVILESITPEARLRWEEDRLGSALVPLWAASEIVRADEPKSYSVPALEEIRRYIASEK